jgi:hypothetical protein
MAPISLEITPPPPPHHYGPGSCEGGLKTNSGNISKPHLLKQKRPPNSEAESERENQTTHAVQVIMIRTCQEPFDPSIFYPSIEEDFPLSSINCVYLNSSIVRVLLDGNILHLKNNY